MLLGRTLEGVPVETVYRTLVGSDGWVVAFGIPVDLLEAPVRRAMILLMVEGAAGLLLAALLTSLVARDLAQRRADEAERAERCLRASEESLAVAVEAADLGVWRWQPEPDGLSGSARCLALLGAPARGPFRWDEAWAALDEADAARLRAARRRSLRDGGKLEEDVRISVANQPPRWLRITGRPFGSDGVPGSLQGVVADITEGKRHEAERKDLLRGLADAQEGERRRIARELHDQVGQTVTGLSLGLRTLQDGMAAPGADPVTLERLDWLRSLAAEIGQDIHRAAADLRPPALDDLGLVSTLAALGRTCTDRHGVEVDVQATGPVDRLSPAIEIVAYRLVQEALTNVIKHAAARTVSVVLERRDGRLRLIVEDDGTGFDPSVVAADGRPRLGLSGMRERLRLLGGTLEVETAPGSGTTLFGTMPDTMPAERSTV